MRSLRQRPWQLPVSMLVVGAWLMVGLFLQIALGPVEWSLTAFPVNVFLLAGLLVLLLTMHLLRRWVYLFRWLSSTTAAIPTVAVVALFLIIMGLIPQINNGNGSSLGLTNMVRFWPFVLLCVWMEVIVGMVSLRQLNTLFHARSLKALPSSLMIHMGFFMALLCATLGHADIQRLRLQAEEGAVESFAVDENNRVKDLDFSILLNDFSVDLYPAKLMIINKKTGNCIPEGTPEILTLDGTLHGGLIDGWNISVEAFYLHASCADKATDTLLYVESAAEGACCAARIVAEKAGVKREGWVSCGSYLFPYAALPLTTDLSVIMPEREPRRFRSDVTIIMDQHQAARDTIEVNHPLKIDGWKIYQLGYDEIMGEWSTLSVLELVKDPWLPFVYGGIGMMILGVILMFFRSPRRKEESL